MADPAPVDTARLDRLHGATVAIEIVRFAKSWALPLLLLAFFAGQERDPPWWLWAGLVGAALGFLLTLVRFFTLRFGVVGDRVVIRSGIVFRQNRTIPVDRVQNLHLKSGLLHRFFHVVEVVVETAGTGEAEASLSVISEARAASFRSEILGGRREPTSEPATEHGDLVRRSTLRELFIAGATENRVGLLMAAAWGVFELGEDVVDEDAMGEWVEQLVPSGAVAATIVVIMLIVGVILFGWIASILWTLVTYHGFTLRRSGEDLRKTHGLLTRFESTIPVSRIQTVRLEASVPRRWLHVLQVRAETAGTRSDEQQGGTTVLAPLLPRAEMDAFCRVVYPDADLESAHLDRVHPRAQRRGFIRLMLPGAVGVGALLVAGHWWAWMLGVPWVLFAYLLARARYRILGYGVMGRFLLARAGVWTRKLWIVPQEKVQAVRVQQSPLQRLLGLATLQLATAGGGSLSHVRIVDMGVHEADSMFERLSRTAARGGAGV